MTPTDELSFSDFVRQENIVCNLPSLGRNDVLIVERSTSQLCKQDVTHTIDQTLGHVSGVVFLGDFVPYKRVSDAG